MSADGGLSLLTSSTITDKTSSVHLYQLTSLSADMAPRTSSRSVIGRCRLLVLPSTNVKMASMWADARRLSAAPKACFHSRHSCVRASFSSSVSKTMEPIVRNRGSSEICTSSFCNASWENAHVRSEHRKLLDRPQFRL